VFWVLTHPQSVDERLVTLAQIRADYAARLARVDEALDGQWAKEKGDESEPASCSVVRAIVYDHTRIAPWTKN